MNTSWIQITIADNGCGIPDEIKQRIFDPFFTTKPVGKGTGMGMSISYQIIADKHHGKLECFSVLGQGTEFCIQIPVQQVVDLT
ncbi:MAG: sensor histidine kinase [Calothrix sp. FI2-JRJ7]|nr:sensor histidine kinase [Calothrix sp. FI2-JRJ7]